MDHAALAGVHVTLTLQCYAYRNGDTWEAVCVDFDIATFAPSLDEVKASLVTCVDLFLEGAAEAPPEDRRLLLRRRSPWLLRAKLATLTWLSRLRNDAHRALQFTLQSSVPAHSWRKRRAGKPDWRLIEPNVPFGMSSPSVPGTVTIRVRPLPNRLK